MRVVANWVSAANIRMVLLSSCSGLSLRTAIEVMRKGADAWLAHMGFRYRGRQGLSVKSQTSRRGHIHLSRSRH
ncbi:MAG: hypothetical protein CBARDMAM_4049 [uncultured Caballeronia sp.]|nr:MAG: hypothetical protein CBARDMAM_4049 [uncultured Caballeronia sp.]